MLRIMLVDDEAWCLKELHDILLDTGQAEVVGMYAHAKEALAEAEKKPPDMVFIDVLMPEMNGLDLAKRLKTMQSGLTVVLVSEKEEYARNGFDIGADDYMLKPVRKERVIQALNRACRNLS